MAAIGGSDRAQRQDRAQGHALGDGAGIGKAVTFGTLAWLLRASGWSLVLLGMLHAAFWKVFEWGDDSARLSPINRRVFIVHASFIVYVLIAFGVLLATRADLFIQKSDLARIVLAGMTLFFALRALAQPLVFDPVLAVGCRWRNALRAVAMLAFLTYVGVFALAWAHQSGALDNPIWKFEANSLRSWLRIGIASVWLMFGLAFKALNLVPRHRLIVRRILGESVAGPATLLIALG